MTTAALVLAAGSASRFGATKQLAELDGRPLIAHVVEIALSVGADDVVVVLGHDADRVASAVPVDPRVRTVRNEHHAEGMASSLVAGVTALGAEVEVAVVLLADQPGIAPDAVRRVAAAAEGHDAARAVYGDGPGHPVAFDRHAFERLRGLRGDVGARDLLADMDVAEVPVAGDTPRDVDTPADLADLDGGGT